MLQSACSVHHFGDDTEGSSNIVTITIHDMADKYQQGNYEAAYVAIDRLLGVGKYKEIAGWGSVSAKQAEDALQLMPAEKRIDLDKEVEFFSIIQHSGEPGVGVRVSSHRLVVRVRFAPGVSVPADDMFYDYTKSLGQVSTERIILAVTRDAGVNFELH